MIRMRDKNLNQEQFNIQLSKTVKKALSSLASQSFANHVLDSPTLLENFSIKYPRTFRETRALCIFLWFLPEGLKFRILLDLKEKSFSHFNQKQRMEIQLLLESKEIMQIYLFETKRYSSSEIFGNFLGNDFKELMSNLKFVQKNFYLKRSQRRRGYQDHGSRRPEDRWKETSDYTLTAEQNRLEKDKNHLDKTITRLIKYLGKFLLKED